MKYTPEDFQKKLMEFQVQKQQEEEKANYMKAPLINNRVSGASMSMGTGVSESEYVTGDYIDT